MKNLMKIVALIVVLLVISLTACSHVVIKDGKSNDTDGKPYYKFSGYVNGAEAYMGSAAYLNFKKSQKITEENATYITSVDNTQVKTSRNERVSLNRQSGSSRSDVDQRAQEHKNRADKALEEARQK